MKDGKVHTVNASGRQWYVNGDTIVQEMVTGSSKLYYVIKYNALGYYESWQESENGVIHGIGVKYDNHLTWHNESNIGGKICKMNEIEIHSQTGVEWKAILMSDDELIYSNTGSMKYK